MVQLTITASGIAFDTDTLEVPADTPFQIVFANNDAGIPHNVAIHEGSPTGPAVWTGRDLQRGRDPDLRRAGPPGRDLRLRLHGPPQHDRHPHGQVAAAGRRGAGAALRPAAREAGARGGLRSRGRRRQGLRVARYDPRMSDNVCYVDAYARSVPASVRAVELPPVEGRGALVLLDRTVFYPGGGGQPADRGEIRAPDGRTWQVVAAKKAGDEIWHELEPGAEPPPAGPDGLHGRPRLGAPPPADAHAHGPARPVRRRLARLRRARDRRQHGARRRPDGLRVRADVGRPRRDDRGDRERGARSAAATSGSPTCRASRRSPSRT